MSIILLAGVCCGLVATSVAKQQKQGQQEKMLLSERLKKLKSVENNVKQLQAVLEEVQKKLDTYNEKIPDPAGFGQFYNQLDAMSKQRDLVLFTIQPQTGSEEKTVTRIPIKLIFNGKFSNIYNMIHALEKMRRAVVIENVSIARSNLEQECRVDMLASIFNKGKSPD